MINRFAYKLSGIRQFDIYFEPLTVSEEASAVLVRPQYLSICSHDQRYFFGKRDTAILKAKLPLALIHEATGIVVADRTNNFSVGTNVVLLPNVLKDEHISEHIKENYNPLSLFRSSTKDGFMQSVIPMDAKRLIPINSIHSRIAVLTEILSVAFNAVHRFLNSTTRIHGETIGVWGDGSIGFVVAIVLKELCPTSHIIVIGKHQSKLRNFTFVKTLDNSDIAVNHAFECVGGVSQEDSLAQIINNIHPQGTITILGFCQDKVPLAICNALEKGLTVFCNNRSTFEDFKDSVDLIERNPVVRNQLESIISNEITARTITDIYNAFESSSKSNFKTIIKWEIEEENK